MGFVFNVDADENRWAMEKTSQDDSASEYDICAWIGTDEESDTYCALRIRIYKNSDSRKLQYLFGLETYDKALQRIGQPDFSGEQIRHLFSAEEKSKVVDLVVKGSRKLIRQAQP